MMPGNDAAKIYVEFREKLRNRATWVVTKRGRRWTFQPSQEFISYLEAESDSSKFEVDLLRALEKGLASYERDRGASERTWIENWYLLPVVTKKYYPRFMKWRETQGLPLLAIDKEIADGLIGADVIIDEYVDPATGEILSPPPRIGNRVIRGRPPIEGDDPPLTPLATPAQRSLLYREGWRQAVRSRKHRQMASRPESECVVRRVGPASLSSALARRLWWRLLAR